MKLNDHMLSIHAMNFNALDLNLIRVFDALLRERNVTRAGQRIGLSQPAVSSALARLRVLLDDPLFLRHGRQMQPTARAIQLGVYVQSAITTLEEGLRPQLPFDPSAIERKFCLLGADFFSVLLMPALSAHIARPAPGIKLAFLDNARDDVAQLLQSGFADIAFEEHAYAPDGFVASPLFSSVFVVALRQDHPILAQTSLQWGDRLPKALFEKLHYAVYSQDGGASGCVLDGLGETTHSQRVALMLPHFYAVAAAASTSELAAIIPCQFADSMAEKLGLVAFRSPIDLGVQKLGMYWHPRLDKRPEHIWLRTKIAEAVVELGFDPSCERYR